MKIIARTTLKGAFTGVCLGMIPVVQVVHAEQVVDPAAAAANRSSLTQSLNGTAVQNIAAPNSAGLSHNKFSTFNVDTRGLVINNSRINAISGIGGAVVANPHLAGGEARMILNEVTSGNRSLLQGPQELLGARAAYILANPNGITCDGCGFINFPRATLTTGSPVLSNGAISGFSINGGDVLVGPLGLNASGTDFFDILTRATVVNGRVNANDLSLVLGRNQVDYLSLAATPLAAAAADPAPAFALDSAALGGMYVGRIWLRSTEAGVGVRALGTVAASVGDVTLDVSGRITFTGNTVGAAGDVALKAAQAQLDGATVVAGNDVLLQAGDVTLTGGRTGAVRDLQIQAGAFNDSGAGVRDAGRDLSVQASGAATVTGSTLQANRNLTATADALALQAGARVMGEADGIATDGSGQTRVTVANALSVQDSALFGGGTLDIAAAGVSVDAASNALGTKGIRGTGAVTVAAATVDNAGLVASDSALTVSATTLDNRSGALMQGASADVAATTLNNAGTVGSTGALAVRADTLANQGTGSLLANGSLALAGNGGATSSLVNGGAIKGQAVSATFQTVANSGQVYGQDSLALTAGALTNNAGGALSTSGSMTLQQAAAGGTLRNAGTVEAGTLAANFTNLQNDAGARIFGGTATLDVSNLANAGQLSSNGALTLNAAAAPGGSLANTGSIDGGDVRAWFTTVTNDGTLYGATALTVDAATLTNRKSIGSGGTMGLAVAELANTSTAAGAADIYAIGDLTISGNHTLANTSATGQIASIASRDGSLSIDSRSGTAATQSVTNSGGLLFGGQNVTVLVANQFLNQASSGLRGYTFANLGNLLLGAPDAASLVASAQPVTVRNVDSDIEARAGSVTVNASVLENTTTDSVPVKQTVYLGWRGGAFDYDGTLDGAGDQVWHDPECGTFADHFDSTQVGKRCTTGVNMYQEQFTAPPANQGLRSRLVAGSDMNLVIENQALNYISLIAAGGNLKISDAGVEAGATTVATATFENRAETLKYWEVATVYRYDDGGRTWNPAGDCYSSGTYDRCFWDSYDHLKRFTNISLATAPFYYTQAIPSTVQAGGAIDISTGQVANTTTGTTSPPPGAGSAPPPTQPVSDPTAAGTVNPQGLTLSALSGITSLASSPFFVPTANPTSPFLYETDPRLMSLAGLYGSDLLLDSLGLDPAAYLRVGDPYFEQQLLRQQLLAQAGQLYIAEGLAGENDQYRLLMANAAAAGEDLKLRVGVALTSEQIANLHKDIVWMVYTEVNGKKALVPQLYLSDVTRAKLADGARFVASSINVKTEGAVTNSGAFVATRDISIDAGTTFTNRMGTLVAAGGLSIQATADILNQSGTLRGGDVALESRTGSVINETLTRDETVHGAHGQGTSTVVGQTATIESTGNLDIKAAQDIVSRGGQITAGQDAKLEAGRDITFTAIERKSLESSVTNKTEGGYTTTQRSSTQKTEQVGSGLTVGGNLDAKAARDINVEASAVDVAGDGRIDAGRDINITALGETTTSQDDSKTTSWNTQSSDSTTVERTTGKASTVNFGGSLTVSSGGDTNIKGSDLAVGGDLDVEKIGGNLNVTTFEETTQVTSTSSRSSFFGGEAKAEAGDNITESKASAKGTLFSKSEETTTIDSTTHRGSGISVGGNLNAGQGAIQGDVNIKGSDIATGGDLNLAAGGDINVLAAEDTTTVTNSSKSTSVYVGAEAGIDGAGAKFGVDHKESNGSATQKTAKVSGLSSGGNMNINAGGDFTEQGTQVEAGGDIGVEARSIKSLAAQDSYTESGDSLSVSVSIGVKAETGLGGVVGSFIDEKGKAGFDMAAASESINGLSVPDAGSAKAELSVSTTKSSFSNSGNDARTSSFSAGGNVTFKAREGDATFEGTQVTAGKSIDVSADKGSVKILAAESGASSSKTTTQADVTIGASADGTISASGSGSKDTESSSSTTQTAASFKAGSDLSISAKQDVTLVGTNLEAGGTAAVTATEGQIDFRAARDTTSSSSHNENANASISVNVTGKEGSVGGGGGTMDTSESSSTGKAGSIKAGNVVLKSKGDITLEGTNIAAKDSATLETHGKVDFKAVEDTYSRTAKGSSGQVDLEAGSRSAGVKAGGSTTDEFEQSSIKTGGSLSAANLTIKAGEGVRLEGTQVDVSKDASIDTGKGKLVVESAVSTTTKRIDNTSAEVGIKGDLKAGSGQGSAKVEGSYEDTKKVTNQNASIKVGGKADIQAAGGIDVKGSNVTDVGSVVQAGTLDTHGAAVSVEQRQDVDQSTRKDVKVSVGVIVPGKKARQEVTDTFNKVKDSKAGTAIRNKAEDAKTGLGLQTKDEGTENKRANNVAYADRKSTESDARITRDQGRKDQKADYDRQKADDRATTERDKALKAIDPTSDAKAQEQAKAKIQADFESKKQANAAKADETRHQNSLDALNARDAYADKTQARKEAAETKAADSRARHAGEDAKVQVALAAKSSNEAGQNPANPPAPVVQAAMAKADQARQDKVAALDTKRNDETKALDRKRDDALAAATGKRDADLAAIAADRTKTAEQKNAESQKVSDTYAKSETKAKEDHRKGKAKVDQDHADGVKKADAEKVRDQGVREAKATQAKQDEIRRKGDAAADKAARQEEAKADNAKVKADNVAKKERADADKKAQDDARKDVTDARAKQKQADADVDRDTTLSEQKKKKRKEANAKTAEDEIAAANQKLSDAKEDNARAEAGKLQDIRTKRDEARADADLRKQEALADAEHDRLALQPTKEVLAAQAAAEKTRKAEVDKVDKKRDAATKDLDRKTDAELAAAGTTRDAERAKIAQDHAEGVKQAGEDHDRDQGVADARKKMADDLDQQRRDRKSEAGKDATAQKDLARLDGQRRKDLDDKVDAKAKEDARIRADDTLSAERKAGDLKASADRLAKDREEVSVAHAKEEEQRKARRDDEARQAEEASLDPKLSPTEKAARQQEIDRKYADRRTEREQARDDKLQAAAEVRARAEADNAIEHTHRAAQGKADDDFKAKAKSLDDQLALDLQAASSAQRKHELQARRDTEVARAGAERDGKRADADKQRAHDDADEAKKREDAALAKETTLTPAERTRRQGEIDKRRTDAKAKADQSLSARKKDIDARRDEEIATAERKKRDDDVDADTALTAEQKEQKKQESEKTFLAAQKAAQAKRDEAKTELAKLMTPEERAAADKLAAKAEGEGARVKNPYALAARAKYYGTKARRWKEVLTSFGLYASTKAPPAAQEEEKEEATFKDLLPLAKQFEAGDQPLALRLLRDPAVQAAAAVTTAVGALREEAREELLKAIVQNETGKELGVLTVDAQRKALAKEGIELPAGLPAAEVTRRFNAYLDAAVASFQPTTEQKLEILQSLGMMADKKTADGTVDKLYTETMDKGRTEAEKEMTRMGLAPAKAKELGGMLAP